ncbi:hypothetical protein F4604DRAFT_1923125 [Suillus subluteus]|nr:hypothetical protein F4604DRAFT_1923125 [Suillus subluteus]
MSNQAARNRYADKSSSSDDSSLSDERITSHNIVQGSISNPAQRQAATQPGSHYSKHEAEEVKNMQLENQALKEQLHAVEEQNKVLSANKGRHKKDSAFSEDIMASEGELKVCTKHFGLMVNMLPPLVALLKMTLPNPPLPFNTTTRYATAGSQELACLAELYDMLPQHLHHLVPMNHFLNVFSKAVCAGHTSELNKLWSSAGQIFKLPQHYFAISHTHDVEPKIRQLLGITGMAGESYPLLPPLLFLGSIVDRTCKTLFSNWQPIAKTLSCCLKGRTSLSNESRRQGSAPPNAVKWGVTAVTPGVVAWAIVVNIFLLSPDQEFLQEGKGKTSRINYGTLYTFFKELLVCDWEKPRLQGIIKHINTFIFERTSCSSHNLNTRDSVDDLQEEMCLARLGLAVEVDEDQPASDDEDADKNLDANIDVLTKAAGTITIHESSDRAPGPPTLSSTTTVTSTLTVSSNSLSISTLQVSDSGPVDETEVVVIKETNIQAVETKSKSKSGRAKKSKVVQEGDDSIP